MTHDDDNLEEPKAVEDTEEDEHLLHHAAEKQHPTDDFVDNTKQVQNFDDLAEESASDDDQIEPQKPTHHNISHDLSDDQVGTEPHRPKTFDLDEDGGLVTEPVRHGSIEASQIPSSGVYTSRRPGRSGGSKLKSLILLIIAIAVTAGSVYLLKTKVLQGTLQASPTPEPTPEVVETPTPAPTPSITRSDFKIRVLNGTPKSGLAGQEGAKLKGLGYDLDKTANATNSAFPATTIRVKAADQDLLTTLITDLAPDFTATGTATLKDSDPDAAEVILGAK